MKVSGHEEAARLPQLHRIRDSSQTGPMQYDGTILDVAKLQRCWQARVSLDSRRELNAANGPGVGYFEFGEMEYCASWARQPSTRGTSKPDQGRPGWRQCVREDPVFIGCGCEASVDANISAFERGSVARDCP
jgi:hypothetical protein